MQIYISLCGHPETPIVAHRRSAELQLQIFKLCGINLLPTATAASNGYELQSLAIVARR